MHSCPDCGSACYCGGDCDDCQIDGTDEQDACTHCLGDELEGFQDDDWHDETEPTTGSDCP